MTYVKGVWVDDDGSGTTGTDVTAARMNNIEDGVEAANASVGAIIFHNGTNSANNVDAATPGLKHQTSGSFLAQGFTTAFYDPFGFWSAAAPSKLTVPAGQGGLYLCTATIRFVANATGDRALTIAKNGLATGERIVRSQVPPAPAGFDTTMNVSQIAPLVAGDQVEIYHEQSSGGALMTSNALVSGTPKPTYPALSIFKLGS